jgi:hypothetical protein
VPLWWDAGTLDGLTLGRSSDNRWEPVSQTTSSVGCNEPRLVDLDPEAVWIGVYADGVRDGKLLLIAYEGSRGSRTCQGQVASVDRACESQSAAKVRVGAYFAKFAGVARPIAETIEQDP